MKDLDIDLINIVLEDLDYLTQDWNQDIDDASLRRTSPILRSLLIEGQLLKISRMLNVDIKIMAPKISYFENDLDVSDVIFYQSGGAKYKGKQVSFTTQTNKVLSPEEIKLNYEKERKLIDKSYPVKLQKFMKQVSFIIEGTKINREEVIKYIANKKGGAHYDKNRTSKKSGSKGDLEKKFILLDTAFKHITVADKNSVYYELLSIGQRIVNSKDIQKIRRKIKYIKKQGS